MNVGLLLVLAVALALMHLGVGRLFATVQCARVAMLWTARRARLAALTDVPRAWSRISRPGATGGAARHAARAERPSDPIRAPPAAG